MNSPIAANIGYGFVLNDEEFNEVCGRLDIVYSRRHLKKWLNKNISENLEIDCVENEFQCEDEDGNFEDSVQTNYVVYSRSVHYDYATSKNAAWVVALNVAKFTTENNSIADKELNEAISALGLEDKQPSWLLYVGTLL